MSDVELIYVMSDNIVEVSDVINVTTGAYLNTATVTITMVDAVSGDSIDGQVWPATLTYITGSNGNYRGMLANEMDISNNQALIAQITVDAGPGLKRYWEKPCIARIGS